MPILDNPVCQSFSVDEVIDRVLLQIPTEYYLLTLPTVYNYYGAKKYKRGSKGLCCCGGTIQLKMNNISTELYDLFTSPSDKSIEFRT